MGTVLIVEDERGVREGLARAVQSTGHKAVQAPGLAEARAELSRQRPDCILLDLRLKDGSGLDLLRELHGSTAEMPVIVVTAYGDSERTIEAMKLGAFDYVTKPFELPALLETIGRAVQKVALAKAVEARPETTEEPPSAPGTLVGSSAAMLQVWKVIGRAAASEAPVLITGETGTGKELVARAIHQHSARKQEPFVAVNLAAVPPTLLESELFGHEKGAFTGAMQRRAGRFEQAAGGTLFLDELGDLELALQTRLLRVLQEQTFERVGGAERLQSRARIIAATNKPVKPGRPGTTLREDLYYRLAVIELELPPLRLRKSDIPQLVSHALKGTAARALTEAAMDRMMRHGWPGNVRELIHVVQRSAALCGGEVIDANDLPEEVGAGAVAVAEEGQNPYETMPLREALAALEKRMIERALEKSGGNRAEAARILNIARPQLYAKMEEHGLGGAKNKDSA